MEHQRGKVTIRRARKSDLYSVTELKSRLDRHHDLPGLWPPEGARRQNLARYRKLVHQRLARLVVAEQSSNGIVGYLTAFIRTRKCDQKDFRQVGVIGEAFVEKRYRNHGIGTTLVDAAARFFSSRGIRHVTLTNAVGNDLANEFWNHLTFTPVLYTRTTTVANLETALQKAEVR